MNLLIGVKQLIQSPSGVFSLLCLAVLSGITIHNPNAIGTAGWAAFFTVLPTALGYFEHKETLATIVNQNNTTVVNQTSGSLMNNPPGSP